MPIYGGGMEIFIMKILIIDDSEDLCNSIGRRLEFQGYSVDCAYDGQKGLRKALSNEYDIILLDVMMPQMNGYEVLKRLKNEERHIPVIMITAKNDISDMIEGLELGADDYIEKPFNADVLLARIRSIARRSKINDYDSDVLRYADITLTLGTRKLATDKLQITLGSNECDIMKYMIKNSTVIVSPEKIPEALNLTGIGRDAVEKCMESLVKRLCYICSRVKLIKIAGIGYKLCC